MTIDKYKYTQNATIPIIDKNETSFGISNISKNKHTTGRALNKYLLYNCF